MPLPIPPEFERAVLERVRSGRYASTDEVLQACLEGLEVLEEADEDLRRELQIGLDALERGERIPAEEAHEMNRRWREDFPELAAASSEESWANLSLTPEMQRLVEEQIRSGRFKSPRDVLEAGLVRLGAEEEGDEHLETLRSEIQLGIDELDRGESYSRDEVIARIRAKLAGGRR